MLCLPTDNLQYQCRTTLRSNALFTLTWAVTGLLVLSQTAHAQMGRIARGGEYILTIRHATPGMSIKQRVDAVETRLNVILTDPRLKASDVQAVSIGKNTAKVVVKEHLLLTIDAETAKASHQTPMQYAKTLAKRLGKVLPKLNHVPNPNLRKG